jgi:predicted PhzF superfamily epimerase YddE/YHI9
MSSKVADATYLIKGINAHYFYPADDFNNTCSACGRLINDMAARWCADCLEGHLTAILGSAEQAAAVHAQAKAVRVAVNTRNNLIESVLKPLGTDAAKQAKAKQLIDALDLCFIDAIEAKDHLTQGACDGADCLVAELAELLANPEQATEIQAKCQAVQAAMQARVNLDAAILAVLAAKED